MPDLFIVLRLYPSNRIQGMSNYIRIRSSLGYRWTWQLTTPDGHVVHESEPYSSRESCERDALEQGLPVSGLARKGRRSPTGRAAEER